MAVQKTKQEVKEKKKHNIALTALYVLIILSIIGYILLGNALFGLIALVLIIITLVAEFRFSVQEEGAKKSIYDVAMAVVAVVVIYLILCAVLGTTSPINVVASCSMLPDLHRGDAILLHGISNMSQFVQQNNVPVVNMSSQQFEGMMSTMQNEFVSYLFYPPLNSTSPYFSSNSSTMVGLYNTACLGNYGYSQRCQADQSGNPIKYSYGVKGISLSGQNDFVATTSNITILNTTVIENPNAPVIVYRTSPSDYFYPETIIHRLYAAIRVGSQYYLLTKGDNNPTLDIQSANYPINQSDVIGYVVLHAPVLGYPSLIVKGQLATPYGCNWVINNG